MLKVAKEVCSEERRGISNPWTVGHDEVLSEMSERIKVAARGRNERVQMMTNGRRLRAMREGRVMERLQEEVERAMEVVRRAKRDLKRNLRMIGREW
jgi:hypothetical protein